jgi:hypothetical protein
VELDLQQFDSLYITGDQASNVLKLVGAPARQTLEASRCPAAPDDSAPSQSRLDAYRPFNNRASESCCLYIHLSSYTVPVCSGHTIIPYSDDEKISANKTSGGTLLTRKTEQGEEMNRMPNCQTCTVRRAISSAVMSGASWISLSAEATSIGKTLELAYRYPDLTNDYAEAAFSAHAFVVGSGLERVGAVEGVTTLVTDFQENELTIDLKPYWRLLFGIRPGSTGSFLRCSLRAAWTLPQR